MKALLALLVAAVAAYFGYQHADRHIANRPPVELPQEFSDVEPLTLTEREKPETDTAPTEEPAPVDPQPDTDPVPDTTPDEPEPDEPDTPDEPSLSGHPAIDFESQTARVSNQSPELDDALGLTLTSGEWTAYRDYLRRSLAAPLGSIAPDAVDGARAPLTTPLVRTALYQERLLSTFDARDLEKHFAPDHSFARWLLGSPDTIAAVVHNLTPKDDRSFLLAFLADLYAESNDELLAYPALAVACGLVHDDNDRPAEANLRFHWYVDKHRTGKLYRDPRSLPVDDLVLVVGGRVPLDQMQWVHDDFSRHAPRSKTGSVYAKIDYRMDLVKGEVKRKDLYPDGRTLAAIHDAGGVCEEQTFFSSHVCRALGIPAVHLSGSGNRGGHAWVGYQDEDGKWTTHGRYADYANGRYRHPQTGSRVIESDLALRSEAVYRTETNRTAIANATAYALFLADSGDLAAATAAAVTTAKEHSKFLPAWDTAFTLVERGVDQRTPALAIPEVLDLVKRYEVALRNYPDVLDRTDTLLVDKLGDQLEPDKLLDILKRRRRRVESYDDGRLDAIVGILRQEAAVHRRVEDPDAIVSLYRQQLRKYGEDLQFFRKLAREFWATTGTDADLQDKALGLLNAEVNGNFKPLLNSTDYFSSDTACKVYLDLAGYYRKAGRKDRAAQIEKRIARVREDNKR